MSISTTTDRQASLAFLGATELLAGFKALEITPLEVLEAQIQRIEWHNGDRDTGINAFTETFFERARVEAAAAGEAYRRCADTGEIPGALLGLTVATKEKHGIAGQSLEQGLAGHAGRIAAVDHPVVARIKAAGGIIHARTTSPEFSCATTTHSTMWGTTRNPWNLQASPGGSSGGAGAALAAGFTTLATASDIAGSTRIPAGFTGTVGYKAPYGRVPAVSALAADWYRGDGPMARSVADTALLAAVISGRHAIDHVSWGENGVNPLAGDDVSGLRIGLSLTLGNYPVAPEILENTLAVARALEAAGAILVNVELPWTTERITETTFAHFGHILGPAMEMETAGSEDKLAAYTSRFIADAATAAGKHSLVESLGMDAQLQAELATAMAGVDVLLCPTSAVASLDADGDYLEGLETSERHLGHYWEAHMTSPFNVANRTAVISVPSGTALNGVPTGVQVVAHPFDEAMAFRVAAGIEALVPGPGYPGLP